VLVVGGGEGMIGAPALAGTAALRTGAGLVQIATLKPILAATLSITPELIGLPLSGTAMASLLKAAEAADALAIGPGMGQLPDAKARLMRLIQLKKLMVLDADALNILAAEKRWPAKFNASAILTPHPGEMKRLAKLLKRSDVPTDDDGRIELATVAATTFKQVLVLKGSRTVVTDGEKVYLNRTGDSSLSKAGTGDVLRGRLATLLAQGLDRCDAACAATWLHGKAGEIAGERLGRRCVLARDVIDAIPAALKAYQPQA
jgi:NAD(P)H-hydrate epimerase